MFLCTVFENSAKGICSSDCWKIVFRANFISLWISEGKKDHEKKLFRHCHLAAFVGEFMIFADSPHFCPRRSQKIINWNSSIASFFTAVDYSEQEISFQADELIEKLFNQFPFSSLLFLKEKEQKKLVKKQLLFKVVTSTQNQYSEKWVNRAEGGMNMVELRWTLLSVI